MEVIDAWLNVNRNRTAPHNIIDLNRLDDANELCAPILMDEVKQLVMRNPRKAPGASLIGRDILIHFPDSLIQSMTDLYNASLSTGYFPSRFKSAIAALIPKPNKDLTNPKNYRPISLLETIGKFFEKIINRRLRRYFDDNDLISSKQFGFRSHRSTQDVLNILTNYCSMNKDKRLTTILVTKDVEKAFDTVWHAALKYKIWRNFNLPPCIAKLLCNFLDNRTMQVKFKNVISENFPLHAGVPQGSSISPTLYTMYTNDLPDPTYPDSITIQYADDCTQLVRFRQHTGVVKRVNKELTFVTRWEHKWRVKTNPEKTKVLIIQPTGRLVRFDPIYLDTYDRNKIPLNRATQVNVLGLIFDQKLNFGPHATQKINIARSALYGLYRFRGSASKTKLHLYKALIRPLLTYAALTLSILTPTNRKKFQIVQNKALRWVYCTRWDEFITNLELHERARLPPLNQYWRWLVWRQTDRLAEWCPDWTEFFHRVQRGFGGDRVANNLLELDWQSGVEPVFGSR